ncbi:hypothetical protein AcV7_006423 [Taiwanofungus camphoratus]|nr:hypothetical protein AcV7_006423 [Antrodia cinnamomea]
MFTTLVSVVLLSTVAIQGARADFTIDTPQLFQCQTATVTWDDTNAAPYNLIVVPSDDVCGDEIADLGDFNSTSATWTVNIAAGQVVTFSLQDAVGDEAWSGSMTVQPGNDTSCLNNTSASFSASASSSFASSTPSSLSISSSAFAIPTAATTLFVGPGPSSPVADDTPSAEPSSSAGAVPVGAANAGDNPTSAGFTMHQLSTPIVIISALAALAISL